MFYIVLGVLLSLGLYTLVICGGDLRYDDYCIKKLFKKDNFITLPFITSVFIVIFVIAIVGGIVTFIFMVASTFILGAIILFIGLPYYIYTKGLK